MGVELARDIRYVIHERIGLRMDDILSMQDMMRSWQSSLENQEEVRQRDRLIEQHQNNVAKRMRVIVSLIVGIAEKTKS